MTIVCNCNRNLYMPETEEWVRCGACGTKHLNPLFKRSPTIEELKAWVEAWDRHLRGLPLIKGSEHDHIYAEGYSRGYFDALSKFIKVLDGDLTTPPEGK